MLWALLIFLAGCTAVDWVHDKAVQIASQPHEPDNSPSREGGPGDSPSPAAAVSTPTPAPADGKARSQGKPGNVQFGFAKWDLDQVAQSYLLVLVKKLLDNPKLTVELQGYTDSVGSRDYNVWLSQKRVETVRRYLLERGVEPARIHSAGVVQILDGGTPEEQAKNRRVTVKLMAPKD
jgi:outer membrane protein OmpA-like peptidoglycan-associated protein